MFYPQSALDNHPGELMVLLLLLLLPLMFLFLFTLLQLVDVTSSSLQSPKQAATIEIPRYSEYKMEHTAASGGLEYVVLSVVSSSS